MDRLLSLLKTSVTILDDADESPIGGWTEPQFDAVRTAFEANFSEHGDVGAGVCVYLNGESVVDLWGG